MPNLAEKLKDFIKTLIYKQELKKIQKKALFDPENVIFQVRIGDLLVKLRKRKEAIDTYEQAAQQFIEKKLFAHAISLKNLITRLEPRQDKVVQDLVIAGLFDQMMENRKRSKNDN
jgi:tetratricopeptide (TPR) repeat protein